jgi:hypothetical protein
MAFHYDARDARQEAVQSAIDAKPVAKTLAQEAAGTF